MSNSSPEPGPMTRRAMELREQRQRMDAFTTQACTMVAQDAAAAEPMLVEALRMTEAYYASVEDLRRQAPPGAQPPPDYSQEAREAKVQILMARAMAANKLRRYKDAAAFYEQVLGLLDASHFMRPTVQMALADVRMKALTDGAS